MRQKKQIKISDIVIPKYLPIFNDRKYKHIILTSGRAGTKSSYVAIRTDYQIKMCIRDRRSQRRQYPVRLCYIRHDRASEFPFLLF